MALGHGPRPSGRLGEPGEVNLGMYHDTGSGPSGGGAGAGQVSGTQGFNFTQGTSQQQASSYIPDYVESPILRQIAQYSAQMAPQVYQWGMEQFNKNQGNIDAMMRNALSYGSASRVASEMGKAQAGVMRGAEAGRQNAIRDLQSYGIDPSSGRYAALDRASQVMAGAAAAGAGNMQRDAVQKTASDMQGQAMGLSQQNLQTGYGASNAMNQLLSTGMQLKFPPLGTTSSASSQNTGGGANQSLSMPAQYVNGTFVTPFSSGGGGSSTGFGTGGFSNISGSGAGGGTPALQYFAGGGDVDMTGYAPEDEMEDSTSGGFVSHDLSPSAGAQTDDVDARLNAGEFVIPKDVAEWKGQEFFYKLMAQARKMRATAGQENGEGETGYAEGGEDSAPQEMAAGGPAGFGAMTGGVQKPPLSAPMGSAPMGSAPMGSTPRPITGGVQGFPGQGFPGQGSPVAGGFPGRGASVAGGFPGQGSPVAGGFPGQLRRPPVTGYGANNYARV